MSTAGCGYKTKQNKKRTIQWIVIMSYIYFQKKNSGNIGIIWTPNRTSSPSWNYFHFWLFALSFSSLSSSHALDFEYVGSPCRTVLLPNRDQEMAQKTGAYAWGARGLNFSISLPIVWPFTHHGCSSSSYSHPPHRPSSSGWVSYSLLGLRTNLKDPHFPKIQPTQSLPKHATCYLFGAEVNKSFEVSG